MGRVAPPRMAIGAHRGYGEDSRPMAEPIVEITRREEFSAAHRLHNPALSAEENRRLYGICINENGHGHNYAFEVTVRGPVPSGTGMVMDLNRLMVILREEIVSVV